METIVETIVMGVVLIAFLVFICWIKNTTSRNEIDLPEEKRSSVFRYKIIKAKTIQKPIKNQSERKRQ